MQRKPKMTLIRYPEIRLGPEEKKELRFDPQNKKKEVRNDQRTVCVIRQFFFAKKKKKFTGYS